MTAVAWLAVAIFVGVYILVATERIHRVAAALGGAALVLGLGIVKSEEAFYSHETGIDWDVIFLLLGMMLVVGVVRRTGLFEFLAIRSAKAAGGRPYRVLVLLVLLAAGASALLDNVTTVLLIAPVTLLITEELDIPAFPFLFAEILFSNIGGTATLIGDPPNILIGSQVESVTFNGFLAHVAPIVPVVFAATLLPIWLIWGRRLKATEQARQRVMDFDAREAITNPRLLIKAIVVLTLVLAGFVAGHPLGLEPATVALFGGALLLLLDNLGRTPEEKSENVHHTMGEVEWVTIFFFLGLFVIVHGLEAAGALDILADQVVHMTSSAADAGEATSILAIAVMWVSAVASAIVDNIPFVATMIPTLKAAMLQLAEAGKELSVEQANAVWWSLSLGACLGGNGSLIGASANLIVAGFAERAGQPIRFLQFLVYAFPLMLMSVAIATLYIWLRYLL